MAGTFARSTCRRIAVQSLEKKMFIVTMNVKRFGFLKSFLKNAMLDCFIFPENRQTGGGSFDKGLTINFFHNKLTIALAVNSFRSSYTA